MRSSTVLSLPSQLGFPDWVDQMSVVQVFFVAEASNHFNVSSAIERPIMQLERKPILTIFFLVLEVKRRRNYVSRAKRKFGKLSID